MRKHLFRGKAVDSGEWVYGIPASFRKIDNVVRATMIPEIGGEHCMSQCVCVAPETVGQFTGMYDHNGTRIFEGDIIADYEPDEDCTAAVGVPVVWHDAGFCVEFPTLFHILERGDREYIAVIGNIHDNPELLDTPPTSP